MSKLDLENIRIDGGTQSRVELNESVVSDYADAIAAGENLPPVVVFFDGADHWLADGFHRYFGHKKLGLVEILADIREGTRRDAVLFSVGANGNHGLRRSNADKRKAVETLLKDADWAKWSDREIARQCGVSHEYVRQTRTAICQPLTDTPATRTVERGGKTYEQNTANIGKKATPAAPAPATQAAPTPAAPAPSPAEDPPQPEDTGPDESELAANRAAEQADREALEKLLEADDKLATAVAEVKRLNHLNAQLQQRINGLMNEKAEAIKLCKSLQRKLDKLQKVEA